jgi:serine/threonine protein kinase
MEYFPLGDLYKVITASDRKCTEEDAQYIASQLLYWLQIMHGLGITHRDLKPQVSSSSQEEDTIECVN